MAKMNLTKIISGRCFRDEFNNTLHEFLVFHPSFCKSVVSRSSVKILTAIEDSITEAARKLVEEDCGTESADVDVEIYTFFEILSGEEPTGISVTKMNLEVVKILLQKLEDRATFDFSAANEIRRNAIKYRQGNKNYLKA